MAVCADTGLPLAWNVRTASEAEANHAALAPLRVRGRDRVRLHADLTILAKLACALTRARIAVA